MKNDADHGTSIPLTINTPPVAKQPVTVGISPAVWPRGQGQVMFEDTLTPIPAMPTVKKARGEK